MAKLRLQRLFHDSEQSVYVLEGINLHHAKSNRFCSCHATLDPVAVIIKDATQTTALDMQGKTVSFNVLRRSHAEFDAVIRKLNTIGSESVGSER